MVPPMPTSETVTVMVSALNGGKFRSVVKKVVKYRFTSIIALRNFEFDPHKKTIKQKTGATSDQTNFLDSKIKISMSLWPGHSAPQGPAPDH